MLALPAPFSDPTQAFERIRPAEYRTLSSMGGKLPGFGDVGTGGIETLLFVQTRAGYSLFAVVGKSALVEAPSCSPFVDLMRGIKVAFGRTMSSLPAVFGVSRQTLYNWLSGETPKEPHQNKIHELAAAGRTFVSLGFTPTSAMLDRTIAEGKSFLQLLAEGRDGTDSAEKLVRLIARTQQSRAALTEILGGRKTPRPGISDMGAPSFDEDA
jgi:transcriptional regulator with XRE-family HTH domain